MTVITSIERLPMHWITDQWVGGIVLG